MFKLIIDNSISALFNDNGLDTRDNNDIMGFLINDNGIKEIVDSLPISRYYINTRNVETGIKEISKEQAFMVYDEIIKYNNQIKRFN